jgi:FixJ family two-component response regulator
MSAPSEPDPCVYVVDDDQRVLSALSRLLSSVGHKVRAFSSPLEFLREHDPEQPGCAIIDIGMSEIDGLTLQERLLSDESKRPVIFLTGYNDALTGVRAIKAGALDYLTKPVQDRALLGAVAAAIEADRKLRQDRKQLGELQRLYNRLTPREVEVLRLVVRGLLNKQIAFELGIVEKTVKVHRGHGMQKLQVHSVAALVRLGERLGLGGPATVPAKSRPEQRRDR